jgi:hypothetical protein
LGNRSVPRSRQAHASFDVARLRRSGHLWRRSAWVPPAKGTEHTTTAWPTRERHPIVRVLVALAPRSYREAVALYIHKHRPQAEVSTISPEGVDAEVRRSSPHLVVYNEVSEAVREVAIAWARILFEDSLDAEVNIDGRGRRVEDVGMDDLLEVFDQTEALLTEGDGVTPEGSSS